MPDSDSDSLGCEAVGSSPKRATLFAMQYSTLTRTTRMAVLLCGLAAPFAAFAYSDVPQSDPAFAATEFLRTQGIMQGYSDGTFRLKQVVTRAEVLKVIIAPRATPEALAALKTTAYTDVPAGSWFLPYVEGGRVLQVIQQPETSPKFRPADPVKHAEFFKMFFLAEKVDVGGTWNDIQLPLSTDVKPSDWYYPFMRYALGSSIIIVDPSGSLAPAKNLTRGELAQYIYRYAMFKAGKRTQALLKESEDDIVNLMRLVDAKQIDAAEQASNRASLAARGALMSKPDAPIVKGAVKVSEGFGFIIRGYRAGTEGRLDDAIALAGNAWQSAQKAKDFDASLADVSNKMQAIAKSIADSARAAKAQPAK